MRNKPLFFILSLVLVAGLAACSPGLGSALSAAAQQPATGEPAAQSPAPVQQPTPGAALRTLSVSGSGKVYLTPDMATVNIGVHSEAENAADALERNTAQVEQVIAALKAAGIEDRDIQTSNFNIYPSQQYGPNGELVGNRHVVDNTVYVTVRDLAKLGALLDSTVQSGANSINGISFDVSDKSEALVEARAQAVANAKALAEELAGVTGVTLGEVQNVSIYTNAGPIPMYDAYGRGGGAAAPAAAEVPVSAGQIVISADVSLVYALQ